MDVVPAFCVINKALLRHLSVKHKLLLTPGCKIDPDRIYRKAIRNAYIVKTIKTGDINTGASQIMSNKLPAGYTQDRCIRLRSSPGIPA